jgi:ubiquinone/menaquinone biosynthesis C-methylase UbiE
MTPDHDSLILEQFTRQAAPFAALPAHSDEYGLDLCLSLAKLGPEDSVLDVACGPGILACAMARTAKSVTGIDFTPAMIEQAKSRQETLRLETLIPASYNNDTLPVSGRDDGPARPCARSQGRGCARPASEGSLDKSTSRLDGMRWQVGDARSLPFNDGSFTLVTSRYAFHHFQNPSLVLAEMKRVCAPGGRILIIDATPDADKKPAYDALEKLRDPSHVSALTPDELKKIATDLGLTEKASRFYRLEMKLEELLSASAIPPENVGQVRALFQKDADTGVDRLGMAAHWKDGVLHLYYPVSILVVTQALCE